MLRQDYAGQESYAGQAGPFTVSPRSLGVGGDGIYLVGGAGFEPFLAGIEECEESLENLRIVPYLLVNIYFMLCLKRTQL